MENAPFSLIPLPYVSWFIVCILLSFIHCITCRITVWVFIFNFSFWVYTNCKHNFCAPHLIGILYITGIWHTGTCCPDIRHFNKYTPGIYCMLLEFQHIYHWIDIMRMVLRGILVSLHFITAWSSPGVYPFYCIYTLYILYTLHACVAIVTLISRVRNVHIWYIYSYIIHYMVYISIQKVHSVYNIVYTYTPHYTIISYRYTYTPGYTTSIQHVYTWFHIQRLSIRPSFIYAFSSKIFSYCPSRLRMLACG